MSVERIGDGPIEDRYHDMMNKLAHAIDGFLNPDMDPQTREGKETGFVLLIFPFDNFDGRCNYISNAKRADIVVLLREQLARFEGMPEAKGTA